MKKVGYPEPLFALKKPIIDALEKAVHAGQIESTVVTTGFFSVSSLASCLEMMLFNYSTNGFVA